jgi:hypothetical protein
VNHRQHFCMLESWTRWHCRNRLPQRSAIIPNCGISFFSIPSANRDANLWCSKELLTSVKIQSHNGTIYTTLLGDVLLAADNLRQERQIVVAAFTRSMAHLKRLLYNHQLKWLRRNEIPK